VEAFDTLMKLLRKKGPEMVARKLFFNALVHTIAVVHEWMATKKIQLLHHPPPPPFTRSCSGRMIPLS
jgi:hypothetical protein